MSENINGVIDAATVAARLNLGGAIDFATAAFKIAPPARYLDHLYFFISGQEIHQRRFCLLFGRPALFTPVSFRLLFQLAWARWLSTVLPMAAPAGGAVHKSDLDPAGNAARYIHRLRGELNDALGDDHATAIVLPESDGRGYYNLGIEGRVIMFDFDRLRRYDDATVRSILTEFLDKAGATAKLDRERPSGGRRMRQTTRPHP